jgi:hypothetical protein
MSSLQRQSTNGGIVESNALVVQNSSMAGELEVLRLLSVSEAGVSQYYVSMWRLVG